MGEGSFWVCLFIIIIAALLPRFVVKVLYQYFTPDDIQIAREAEKFGNLRDIPVEVEMNPIMEPSSPRR
jgi:phospholipid-transporting ATPase